MSEVENQPNKSVQLWGAHMGALEGRAVSPEARALVKAICERVGALDQRKKRSAAREASRDRATEAFVTMVLLASNGEQYGYCSLATSAEAFKGRSVSVRDFAVVRGALSTNHLVEDKPGYKSFDFHTSRSALTRFRAEPKLSSLATQHGITPQNVGAHFVSGLPTKPIIIRRTKKFHGEPRDGGAMAIAPKWALRANDLKMELQRFNEFIASHEIGGAICHGFVRGYSCGDHPRFNFNMGGRRYAQGPQNYQQQNKEARLNITLDGQPVCEIDIRASFLSLYCAQHNVQLDLSHDPYTFDGFDRDVVKQYINVAFGRGKLLQKWSPTVVKAFADKTGKNLRSFPIKAVRGAVLSAYPMLDALSDQQETYGPPWAYLQWLESEIIGWAMSRLLEQNIPSLPVHDSLIVPKANRDQAMEHLQMGFRKVSRGHEVVLKVNSATDTHLAST